ncbi:MAG TPA: ABC transporter permease [Vicinamibacterales bacterium]
MFADLVSDMRYALRQLIKTPGFTLVAILTLAFGIGATSAIFSVVNSVLLRPLPFPEPERLVRVHETVPQYGRFSVAPATFFDWRSQNTVFERMAAYGSSSATFDFPAGPERLTGTIVTWDLFDLLGVPPAHGRGFREDEDLPGRNDVIVISHGTWQSRFGGSPDVLGRPTSVNGTPVTIVGVMPPGFAFPGRTVEFWRPMAINQATASRGGHFLAAIARLKPGVPIERAQAEIKAISERLATEYPQNSAGESAEALLLHDQIVGPIRPMLLTLLAAVAVVVLIACANVANLLLVRASVREKEIAIRAAMGAGTRRLARQMLTESLVLAAAGGALGLLLAYLAITPIQTLSAGSIPRAAEIALDARVLAFAFGLTLTTGVLFGLAPAWQASRAGLGAVLKEGGRSSSTSGGRWVRSALLVGEVALSLMLLVGAALLLRSFTNLTSVDPGFDADRVLAFQVALPPAAYPEDHNRAAFFDTLLGKLGASHGVEAVGMVQSLPISGGYVLSFEIQGRPPAQPGEEPSANFRSISPGYFRAMGIPLIRGRAFTERDTATSPMVAVIDEAFARRHFPNEDPIGRGLDIGNGTEGFYEIVGVVGDVRYEGLDTTADPSMYVPYKQDVFSSMWMLARTPGDPAAAAGAARQALREIDRGLPAYSMRPLAGVVDESVAERRFSMLLLGLFALVALFLAAVGLYGVVSYTVGQRTQEIGLRMAIGAAPSQVLRMVVGGGMKLAIIGVVVGIAASLALASLVASLLFGVTPFDPISYAATAAVLLAVAALACFVPARRAMRVDPIIALRQE